MWNSHSEQIQATIGTVPGRIRAKFRPDTDQYTGVSSGVKQLPGLTVLLFAASAVMVTFGPCCDNMFPQTAGAAVFIILGNHKGFVTVLAAIYVWTEQHPPAVNFQRGPDGEKFRHLSPGLI